MLNTERLLKHAVQERLAITICINKVRVFLDDVGTFPVFFVKIQKNRHPVKLGSCISLIGSELKQ